MSALILNLVYVYIITYSYNTKLLSYKAIKKVVFGVFSAKFGGCVLFLAPHCASSSDLRKHILTVINVLLLSRCSSLASTAQHVTKFLQVCHSHTTSLSHQKHLRGQSSA